MAKFSLTIETSDDIEFAALAMRLAGQPQIITSGEPAPVVEAAAPKGRKPATAVKPEPSTSATDAASIAAAQNSGQGEKETKVNAPDPDPAPEPEAPAEIQPAPTAIGTGDVTLDVLKDKMKKLLDKGSAKVLQDTIREAGGGASSIGQVDPSLYGAVNAAFDAALA